MDRCLGKKALNALRAAGETCEWADDHFDQDAVDVDWIPEVTQRGWVILTKDKNIRKSSVEREALIGARARYFALGRSDRTGPEQVEILLGWLAAMRRQAQRKPPTIVQVNKHTCDRWDRRKEEWVPVKKKKKDG